MKVLIIGGIAAGMSAAAKLHRMDPDAEITVYEKSAYVSFGACGLPYLAAGYVPDPSVLFARTPEAVEKSGIKVRIRHEAFQLDPIAKTVQIRNLETGTEFQDSYDRLMIATGAASVDPPIENLNVEGVHQLRTYPDGLELQAALLDEKVKTVGIIGGGFIGMELIETAKARQKEVHVFQISEQILRGTFDPEITSILEEGLRQEGVHLHLLETVTEILGEGRVRGVKTPKGTYDLDLVVAAAGIRPATQWLEGTGINMLPNGALVIDEEGRTSLEDVYAAGDCATINHFQKPEPAFIPLATGANKLGRLVGENLAGQHNAYQGSLGSACLKIMDFEAARTGLSEEEAKALGHDVKAVTITDKNQTNYYPGQADITIKLIYDRSSKVILGGQAVGTKDVVGRVNVIATAIFAKLTTQQLAMLDFCYSPPFARVWDALNVVGNVAK